MLGGFFGKKKTVEKPEKTITRYFLQGDALKEFFSSTRSEIFGNRSSSSEYNSFGEKYLAEKAISDYEENIDQVANDINRIHKIIIHNADRDPQSREYTMEEIAIFLNDIREKKQDPEQAKKELAQDIISYITDDESMKAYLRSEFHQAGSAMISANALINIPLSLNPSRLATTSIMSIDITAQKEGNLKLFSQTIFSDQILYPNAMEKSHLPEKSSDLFLCNIELDIQLINNPDANPDDPPEKKKKISITPSLEIYVIPGREALFSQHFDDFVKLAKLQKEIIPIKDVPSEKIQLIQKDLDPEDFVVIDEEENVRKPLPQYYYEASSKKSSPATPIPIVAHVGGSLQALKQHLLQKQKNGELNAKKYQIQNIEYSEDSNKMTLTMHGNHKETYPVYASERADKDGIDFAISKSIPEDERHIIIKNMCQMAVGNAEKNAPFTLSDAYADKKEIIKAYLKDAAIEFNKPIVIDDELFEPSSSIKSKL